MENWYERIEDYNLGKLSALQREQFETAMTADPALSEAVRQHRAEWEAGELLAEKILREQIREQFGKHSVNTGKRPPNHWKWIVPVALLLMAGLAFFIIKNQLKSPQEERPSPPSPTKDTLIRNPSIPIAQDYPDTPTQKPDRVKDTNPGRKNDYKALAMAAYRTPDGLSSGVRGTSSDSLTLAQQAFANKNYRLALRYLNPLPADSRQEGLALRGHAHFLAGDYTAAGADFSDLLAGGVYIRDAQWFGLLADMARPGVNKKALLQRLDAIRLDKYHPWQEDAAALWERLK